jgi:L-threonylcarbamoyladenylate synthase
MEAGEPVIVPTDTIYGIATKMIDASVIQRLYDTRGRGREPALPFLAASSTAVASLGRFSTMALRLARKFWPGTLTLILPPATDLPVYARAHPIAVRVPNYLPLLPLLRLMNGTMLATGAIRSGFPPAITAQEAAGLFGDEVSLILDAGPSPYGIPSTIVDCLTDPPVIARRGAIPESSIWQALGLTGGASFIEGL